MQEKRHATEHGGMIILREQDSTLGSLVDTRIYLEQGRQEIDGVLITELSVGQTNDQGYSESATLHLTPSQVASLFTALSRVMNNNYS